MTDIEVLGEIRCRYNLFDVKEQRYYEALSNAIQALSNASNALKPLVNAVEVVRCRDCRHRDPEDHKCESGGMERQGRPFPVDDEYYCSYGERREEEHDG